MRVNLEKFIYKEAGKMQTLSKFKFFPKIYSFIKESNSFFLLESIQDPDLKKFLNFSQKIDLNTAFRLGIEILLNLKVLH